MNDVKLNLRKVVKEGMNGFGEDESDSPIKELLRKHAFAVRSPKIWPSYIKSVKEILEVQGEAENVVFCVKPPNMWMQCFRIEKL